MDERLQKDLGDYISTRITRSPSIQTNITPSKLSRMSGGEESPAARFQAHLVGAARGSFLYVQLVLDLVERGSLTVKSSSFKVMDISVYGIINGTVS